MNEYNQREVWKLKSCIRCFGDIFKQVVGSGADRCTVWTCLQCGCDHYKIGGIILGYNKETSQIVASRAADMARDALDGMSKINIAKKYGISPVAVDRALFNEGHESLIANCNLKLFKNVKYNRGPDGKKTTTVTPITKPEPGMVRKMEPMEILELFLRDNSLGSHLYKILASELARLHDEVIRTAEELGLVQASLTKSNVRQRDEHFDNQGNEEEVRALRREHKDLQEENIELHEDRAKLLVLINGKTAGERLDGHYELGPMDPITKRCRLIKKE